MILWLIISFSHFKFCKKLVQFLKKLKEWRNCPFNSETCIGKVLYNIFFFHFQNHNLLYEFADDVKQKEKWLIATINKNDKKIQTPRILKSYIIKQKTTITEVQLQRIKVQITEQCEIRDNHGPEMKKNGKLQRRSGQKTMQSHMLNKVRLILCCLVMKNHFTRRFGF